MTRVRRYNYLHATYVTHMKCLSYGRRNFKDTNPLMSSLLVIFVGSESSQTQSVKLLQNMAHSTFQHPHRHTLSAFTVHCEGGGGGQREGTVEGQQYTSIVPSSFVHGGNSSQAGSKIQNMSECISSL